MDDTKVQGQLRISSTTLDADLRSSGALSKPCQSRNPSELPAPARFDSGRSNSQQRALSGVSLRQNWMNEAFWQPSMKKRISPIWREGKRRHGLPRSHATVDPTY